MTERRVLVIDTATHAVVTGLAAVTASGAREVSSRVVADERRHAETLTTLMADCLLEAGWDGADLDAVVVGCGPGPFTGLRVGMATAAAYGDALGIPVYGVCSLDAIAAVAVRESGTRSVLVVTDARRREVYWARFLDGECVAGPGVIAPAVLVDELAHDAAERVGEVLDRDGVLHLTEPHTATRREHAVRGVGEGAVAPHLGRQAVDAGHETGRQIGRAHV